MDLKDLKENWDRMGSQDPLYGVLSDPAKRGRRWEHADFFATGEAEVAALLARLKALGLTPRLGRALDFGCAVGRLSQALGRRFKAVVGVDIAPSMLAEAARLNRRGRRVQYRLNTEPHLGQFAGSSFDLVYSNMVLQHMEPRYAEAYVSEFLRVLKPGGLAVFQVPAKAQYPAWRLALKRLAPKALLRAWRRLRYGAGHDPELEVEMHGLDPARVRALVAAAGGELKRQEGDMYYCLKPAQAGR